MLNANTLSLSFNNCLSLTAVTSSFLESFQVRLIFQKVSMCFCWSLLRCLLKILHSDELMPVFFMSVLFEG